MIRDSFSKFCCNSDVDIKYVPTERDRANYTRIYLKQYARTQTECIYVRTTTAVGTPIRQQAAQRLPTGYLRIHEWARAWTMRSGLMRRMHRVAPERVHRGTAQESAL